VLIGKLDAIPRKIWKKDHGKADHRALTGTEIADRAHHERETGYRQAIATKECWCYTPHLPGESQYGTTIELANKKDIFGRTPLSYAAWSGHEAVMRLLLDHGADVDARDKDGVKALIGAAWSPKIVHALNPTAMKVRKVQYWWHRQNFYEPK
jgi:hypothetical protein